MKIVWQQTLAFLLVILTALVVSSLLITKAMEEQIYARREKELLQIAHTVGYSTDTRQDFERTAFILQQIGVVFEIYSADGTVIYPYSNQGAYAKLTPEELEMINQGKTLGIRSTDRISPDLPQKRLVAVYMPLMYEPGQPPISILAILSPLAELDEQIEQMQRILFYAFAIAALVSIVVGLSYTFYQTKRITKLQKATRQIQKGDYDVQLSTTGQDEIADLSRSFVEMAKSLEQAQAQLKHNERLRRQMMQDAAHEMRTPLTTMYGVIEGLQYGVFDEDQQARSLELLANETERLRRLVNENLDYEKIRSGEIVLKPQWLNVRNLFEQIKTQLNTQAKEKGNHIVIEAPEHLSVYADHDRLIQVLINLTHNAIQFTNQGHIWLSATEDEAWTLIQVRDEGIGIKPEDIEKIWERFYKADVSRKSTQFGESGIGLAVVQSLVNAHGGHITVESPDQKGTLFTLSFPKKTIGEKEDDH
ncbi:sensor histidine kinase [Dolosicoccus paucivorans]|uniref:histidine kinase n=1 Tax=Dolosicoccus paucivorans TaxID=84521 RepID=A0A2N6SN09_9LACT|nr:HAMP domain-containing sensor histidine kinase [Dolosicoccus paucivorans]PMB84176.1 sensor histidine kinase [Dolosicoccus paucivorans]PMC58426.1 sensor histidine kinase [Dolosicoccus paucivorans]